MGGAVPPLFLEIAMAIISEFAAALNQVCSEKGISAASVLETIKLALISAYRKDYGGQLEELRVELSPETGEAKIFEGEKEVTPPFFGRIASQTAKQVLLQKLREAEKEAILVEFRKKLGTVYSAHIFRLDKGNVILDLGRCQGFMPPQEQIPGENYKINQRLRVLLKDIHDSEGGRGPEVIVSRADPKFVEQLFSLEVPELNAGTVKIAAIAREAGARTKMAVASGDSRVDPVGSCVGQKGVRVQAVIAELGNEKIDIIAYDESPEKFIAASLSPAKAREVSLNKKKREAKVRVAEDQLSLAIGREGQNVRLAARLTGWKIDILGANLIKGAAEEKGEKVAVGEVLVEAGLGKRLAGVLGKAGINSLKELSNLSEENLSKIKGLGIKGLAEIRKVLGKAGE